jgi:hypothetical protein
MSLPRLRCMKSSATKPPLRNDTARDESNQSHIGSCPFSTLSIRSASAS